MKSHEEQSRQLNRFARSRLGRMIASEVTNRDIATLQHDIIAGTLIVVPQGATGSGQQRPPYAQGGLRPVQLGG